MTEDTKKQKLGEDEELKYLYIAKMDAMVYYPNCSEFDTMDEVWRSSSEMLFRRLFETRGWKLIFPEFNHQLKGCVIGPYSAYVTNAIVHAIELTHDKYHIVKVFPSRDMYKVNDTYKPKVIVRSEEKTITKWSISNLN